MNDKSPFVGINGDVHIDGRLVGYVDHFNPAAPNKPSQKWRAVHEGGRFRFGFKRRTDAIDWLAKS